MAKELVNLTTKNDQLEEKLDSLVTLQQQYKVGAMTSSSLIPHSQCGSSQVTSASSHVTLRLLCILNFVIECSIRA